MRIKTVSKLTAALALVGALALTAFAGTAVADGPTLDPSNADALAHQAILQPGDLPGSAWTIGQTDVFSDDDTSSVPDTAACKNSQGVITSTTKDFDAQSRAGRAEQQLNLPDSANVGVQVDNEIDVFQTNADLSGVFAKLKPIVLGSDYGQCIKDGLSAALNDSTMTEKDGTLLGSAPNGGLARAIDVSVGSVNLNLHLEFYIWQYGNATEQLQIFANKDTITPDMVKGALSAAQDHIKAAAGS